MHVLSQLAISFTLFLFAIGGIVAWKAIPQLHFIEKGMVWTWHWEYFLPFSNGIQTTRTQDTKQLLLRRVYLQEATAVFVGTTLDNKLEIDVVNEEECEPESSKRAFVSINGQPMSFVSMLCEASGEGYIYRFVGKKLKSLEFGIGEQLGTDEYFIREDFSQWPISEIKVDQFKQQHSAFFNKHGNDQKHQWLRD